MDDTAAGVGILARAMSVLRCFTDDEPELTAAQLSGRTGLAPSTLHRLLAQLGEFGLIARAPIDGKSQGLALTDAGRGKLAEGRKVIEQFERELIERVPKEHRAHLLPALNAIWR